MNMPAQAELKVKLPLKLANDVEEILFKRGLTMDEVVRLYLRSLVTASKRNRALRLDSIIEFGKYNGETVETIVRADPSYVNWLVSTSTKIKFDPEVLELLERLAEGED
jgi:antitoxin component of RelBE/YafQ-DinJ toxin-antitoxin module